MVSNDIKKYFSAGKCSKATFNRKKKVSTEVNQLVDNIVIQEMETEVL